jgi:uncharacterized protein (TIGR03435 family)
MSAIQILATQPWVERLGMTLVHFLWQGALIAAIYAAARKWGASFGLRGGPDSRYLLAGAALMAMAIAPMVTWMLLSGPAPESIAATFAAPLSNAPSESAQTLALSLPTHAGPATPGAFYGWPRAFYGWIVAFWFTGATAFMLRLLGGWILAERLRYRMVRPAPAEWQRTFDRLKTRISISRPVRLLVSGLLQTPAVIGWLRPLVLVPAGILAGLPAEQLEALLLHELAHIRRHDYLVNILQSAVEAVFFYHPAVWWISGHMRAERELCCDDIAVSITGDAFMYARALFELDSARLIQPSVMAANGGSLADRIARLLGHSSTSRRASRGPGIAPALILLAIGAWAILAQPAARPEFEVASIKPSFSASVMSVRPLPGRLTADATLQVLTQYAYGVQPSQVVGGPEWIQSERYQIEAKADADASRDRMFLMLQSLLENRFRLKTHRETKDLPVYALVAARNGLKMPAPKEGGCVDAVADASPDWVGGGRMLTPGDVQRAQVRCGSAGLALGPAGARMQGEKIAMPELVRVLSMLLGRSVIDKTGFTGVFDLQLNFVPDENTPAMPAPPPGSPISGSSLSQALRQQLGVQLELTKGAVDVIVVDNAERPSGN